MSNPLRKPLEDIAGALDGGAFAVTIMGKDCLPVDSVEASADDVDVSSLLVEYSALLDQMQKSAQMFAAGGLQEFSIRSDNLTMIIRPINEDYMLCLALSPRANFGKGRYLVRLHAPSLATALS